MLEIKNKSFAYAISDTAENLYFKDLRNGEDHLSSTPSVCSYLTLKDGTVKNAVAALFVGGLLSLTYENGMTAKVEITDGGDYFIFTLKEVSSEDFLKIAFIHIPIDIDYHQYIANSDAHSYFTATLMGLTCATRMAEHPGRNLTLRAEGYPRIGLWGTRGHSDRPVRAAVFGAPDGKIRDIMKKVIELIPDGELPKSKKGGPYAMDCGEGRETYITLHSNFKAEAVPSVVEKCKTLGIRQISYHQGSGYTQGDFALNKYLFPNGEEDFRQMMDGLHAAGLKVLLHSYTFFVSSLSRYVSGTPHEDLDTTCHLTLACDIDENATEIPFLEEPTALSALFEGEKVSAEFVKIGNELVHFNGVRRTPPYALLDCERAYHSTTATAHKAGEDIAQIKEYFAHYLPKADSPLFYEVAKNTADFYNKYGFDGFYMDAIDGVFALEGNEYAWYYAMEFITEVYNHLDSDPIFDCCYNPQYTASWYIRSRYGALDHGTKALRNYIDSHVYYNDTTAERMYLPSELGWFAFNSHFYTPGWQSRYMREEDVEYLCNRIVANDACFSYNGNEFREFGQNPMMDRVLSVYKRYDDAREKLSLSPEQCRLLRTPGNEYSLRTDKDEPYFLESKTLHLYEDAHHKDIAVKNPFTEKKPTLRLFPKTGAEGFDAEGAIALPSLPNAPLPAHSEIEFAPIAAGENTAVCFRVIGDGSGAVLRLRLRRYTHKIPEGQADFHIKVDFVGERYFAFYETENTDDPNGAFPPYRLQYRVFKDVSEFYTNYRNHKVFEAIDTLTVDIEGDYTDIRLGEIHLVKPRKITYENPSLTIGGKTVTFPCTMESQQVIECDLSGRCVLATAAGAVIEELPNIDIPALPAGESTVSVNPGTPDPEARLEVVLHLVGDKTL